MGPTPMSSTPTPAMVPAATTDSTVPRAAEVAMVIAAGLSGSANFNSASWPLALSPTL